MIFNDHGITRQTITCVARKLGSHGPYVPVKETVSAETRAGAIELLKLEWDVLVIQEVTSHVLN